MNAEEFHTSVSAHPRANVPAGRYDLLVERGRSISPPPGGQRGAAPASVRVPLALDQPGGARLVLRRHHVHRTIDELRTVMQAEDLNVAFPLSYWVTRAFTPPATGDKNLGGEIPGELIKLDDTHVMWPRNTEYEIFTVGGARHTLGAVFVLGHKSVFTEGVPPVTAVAERARAEGALLDMDKHDWPWAMALPSLMGVKLYELANNHIWRTQFGFTNWSTPAPPHLRPPFGGSSGGEREWIHYTLGNYYALLSCGFRLRPTAGTANGVHPCRWGLGASTFTCRGLQLRGVETRPRRGRSFVTTADAFARVNRPGQVFPGHGGNVVQTHRFLVSEQPSLSPNSSTTVSRFVCCASRVDADRRGANEGTLDAEITLDESGWLAVRCWEDRPGRASGTRTAQPGT